MAIEMPDGFDLMTASDHRVTYHYRLLGAWGTSHQELTVNVPMLKGLDDETGKYGLELWKILIAPATSVTTLLIGLLWSTSPGAGIWLPVAGLPAAGAQGGHQGDRDGSACITLDAGVMDRYGSKPFFLAGFPSRFSVDGIVTDVGLRLLERQCHIAVMGLTDTNSLDTGKLYQRWELEDEFGRPMPGVYGYRRVLGFRVMQHTARAPDYRAPF